MTASRPDRLPSVKSVMTPFPWSIDGDAPLARAVTLMEEHGIGHLPVTDDGELSGIVSARDIELVEYASGKGERRKSLIVADAYHRDAYIVDHSAHLDGVLLDMAERHIEAALVTRSGRLAGIFTVSDVYRSYGKLLRTLLPERDGGDAA